MAVKLCSKCKKKLSTNKFSKDKNRKDGLYHCCKICRSKYYKEHYRERTKEYTKRNKKHAREYHFMRSYNLTLKQHKQMYINQNGCCLICNRPIPYDDIKVDHSHETDKVRGLLCFMCNLRLGWYEKRKQNIKNYLGE